MVLLEQFKSLLLEPGQTWNNSGKKSPVN